MAIGDIGSALLDSLMFDTNGSQPSIVHVSGDIYAIAYQGGSSDGWLVTVEIDEDGNITDPVKASYEFDAGQGQAPSIVKVADTVYAISYRATSGVGTCITITIGNDGAIGSIIDTLEFETTYYLPRGNFMHITGDIYADAYQGGPTNATYLTVKTFDIASNGDIGSVKGTLSIPIDQNKAIELAHITGSLYAVAFQQLINTTQVKTFTIDGSGNFSAVLATATIDAASGALGITLIKVSGSIYVLGYDDPVNGGKLATMTISSNGAIGSIIDTESVGGSADSMVMVSGGVLLLTYSVGSAPWLKTIKVELDGQITTSIDSLQFTTVGNYMEILHLSGDVYIIVYTEAASDGMVATIGVERGAVYPSDATIRVTNLIHRYNRAEQIYELEMALGEVTSDYGLPSWVGKVVSPVPEAPVPRPTWWPEPPGGGQPPDVPGLPGVPMPGRVFPRPGLIPIEPSEGAPTPPPSVPMPGRVPPRFEITAIEPTGRRGRLTPEELRDVPAMREFRRGRMPRFGPAGPEPGLSLGAEIAKKAREAQEWIKGLFGW